MVVGFWVWVGGGRGMKGGGLELSKVERVMNWVILYIPYRQISHHYHTYLPTYLDLENIIPVLGN